MSKHNSKFQIPFSLEISFHHFFKFYNSYVQTPTKCLNPLWNHSGPEPTNPIYHNIAEKYKRKQKWEKQVYNSRNDRTGCYILPLLNNRSTSNGSRNIPGVSNRCGYLLCISRSVSQVASSTGWPLHCTFTEAMSFDLNLRTYRSKIATSSTS